jgi:hypothetical protein
MAQQDGLMQNLIQYFLGVENGEGVFSFVLLCFLFLGFSAWVSDVLFIYFLVQAK